MRSKDLARTAPVDFYFPQYNKKQKSDTRYIPHNINYSLYNSMPRTPTADSPTIKTPTAETPTKKPAKDIFDSILQKLQDLTVNSEKEVIHDNKIELLNIKKEILDVRIEPRLEHDRFLKRFEATAIPVVDEVVEPLTEEENRIVDGLFGKGQSGQISHLKNATVSFTDMYRLYPETWLNDEIVNFYFELLSDRASRSEGLPLIHCFNTFFCSTLRDQGYNKVRRWTKRVDVFTKDLLFIPINQSYHWVLGVIDLKNKIVSVYDSLGGNHDHTLSLFLDYLQKEHLDKKKTPYDISDWKKSTPKDIPRQGNMSDCGAFACTFAERLSRDKPFNFSQQDMVTIRRRIALNIYNKVI